MYSVVDSTDPHDHSCNRMLANDYREAPEPAHYRTKQGQANSKFPRPMIYSAESDVSSEVLYYGGSRLFWALNLS